MQLKSKTKSLLASLALVVLVLPTFQCQHQVDDLQDPTGYFAKDSLHNNYDHRLTFDQYVSYSIRSLAQVAGFDNDLHRYDAKQDLLDSYDARLTSGNFSSAIDGSWGSQQQQQSARRKQMQLQRRQMLQRVDSSELELFADQDQQTVLANELAQEQCSRQLDQLIELVLGVQKNFDSYSTSRQLGLLDLVDSFGAAPGEQLLLGSHLWLGSHEQCRRARVTVPVEGQRQQQIDGRYCVAKLRSPNWAAAQPGAGHQSIRLGVCLPRACNSVSMLRHSAKLETLVKLVRLQQVPLSSFKLDGLFCLPDESSPLRQLSGSARLFVVSLGLWLALVVYYSLKYEFQLISCTGLGQAEPAEQELGTCVKIFAWRYCWRALFCGRSRNTPQARWPPAPKQETPAQYLHANLSQAVAPTQWKSAHRFEGPRDRALPAGLNCRTNLAPIDGIKVLSMIWLISAHTMLFFLRTISNGRDFWSIITDARFMTIMAGIFPVDSFFAVTGVLTAYLKFSKSRGRAMSRPSYWLEAFVRRYLRFMPMYVLVFWYTRDVSQYVGQGPLWDYATANTSLRSVCKQESLAVPLLFQANLKPIDQHCVKPAWYLANDYQYLLVTPVYMLLLIWSRSLGYLLIGGSLLASLAAQFCTVYFSQHFADFEGLVNFRPMFATYVLKDLWKLYTLPYNRIAPYLIGLLTGHLMYSRAQTDDNAGHEDQLVCNKSARASNAMAGDDDNNHHHQQQQQNNGDDKQQCELKQTGRTIPMMMAAEPPSTRVNFAGPRQIHIDNSATALARTLRAAPTPAARVVAGADANEDDDNQQRCSTHSSKASSSVESLSRQASLSANNDDDTSSATSSNQQQQSSRENILHATMKRADLGQRRHHNNNGKGNSLWPILKHFVNYHLSIKVWTPLMLLISIIYLPMLTKLTTLQGEQAHIGASLIIALMRFVWSISIARLIYVCCHGCCSPSSGLSLTASSDSASGQPSANTTITKHDSFVVGLLGASLWRPWSKIGLSVLLIQWEIIGYLAQVQALPPFMSITYMLAFVCMSIVASYVIGLLVYLTIEFPLSQIEHYYIHPKLFGGVSK